MLIRPYQPCEETALLTLFQASVRNLATHDYTQEQIDAWAPKEITEEMRIQWVARIRSNNPWVVEVNSELAGFADLQATGYIDQFFIAPAYARQGVGSALMEHLQRLAAGRGIRNLYAHVSLTAQPFFSRHGFSVKEERMVTIRNVVLRNALMSKNLDSSCLTG